MVEEKKYKVKELRGNDMFELLGIIGDTLMFIADAGNIGGFISEHRLKK